MADTPNSNGVQLVLDATTDRPKTLNLTASVESENLLSVNNSTPHSTKSDDVSVASFTSDDFAILRSQEGIDMDMGQVNTAADIFDHSDIEADDTTWLAENFNWLLCGDPFTVRPA